MPATPFGYRAIVKGDMSKLELIRDCTAPRTAVIVLSAGYLAAPAVGDLLVTLGCDAPASERDGTSKIAVLNEAVLQSSGTLPRDWTPFNSSWLASPKATEFLKRALEILQDDFGGSYLSVVQDASTIRLLPFWKVVFDRAGVVPRYLFIVSDPRAVADDLYKRFGIETRVGHLIWLRAALDAEANSRGGLRAFVHTSQLSREPASTMNSVAGALKLTFPRDVQSTFASRNSRKQFRELVRRSEAAATSGASAHVTADWVGATHQILDHWASNGETADGRPVLDAIREAFDEAAPAFIGIEPSAASNNFKLRELQQELESARGAAQKEINELCKAKADVTRALEDAQEELRARYSEIVTLTRMLATETSAARKFERNAARLGAIAQAFERGGTKPGIRGWIGWILPWHWHVRRIRRRIEGEGLFDSRAYVAANADVRDAGVDPLRHYISHGASEGRPLGID